jgi:uroporphyrinogen decarboxylase
LDAILVIPDAMNQKVSFVEGEGPRLEALGSPEGLARLAVEIDLERLAPVSRDDCARKA